MSIIDIFLLVLIIIAIVVGIYLIITLKKTIDTLDIVKDEITELNSKLDPILDNVSVITSKAVNISNETEQRVLDISKTIQNVRNTVSKFSLRGKGTSNQNPVKELLTNISAISKGVSTFWNKLNN